MAGIKTQLLNTLFALQETINLPRGTQEERRVFRDIVLGHCRLIYSCILKVANLPVQSQERITTSMRAIKDECAFAYRGFKQFLSTRDPNMLVSINVVTDHYVPIIVQPARRRPLRNRN